MDLGTPAAEVVPEFAVAPSDFVLSRIHGLNPMAGTDLDPILRNLGARTIVVIGVSVNVAVTNLVMDAVNKAASKPRAYTTVMTLLGRLEVKGYVASDKSGFAHVFRAAVSRDDVVHQHLATLANEFCDGQPAPLVLALVQGQRFTADELAEFRRLIDELAENVVGVRQHADPCDTEAHGLRSRRQSSLHQEIADGRDEPAAPPHDRGHDGTQSVTGDAAIICACRGQVRPLLRPLT